MRPRRADFALLVALCLLLGYGIAARAIPRGPAEFAYGNSPLSWPFGAMRGFTVEQLASHVGRALLLGSALAALAWWLARRWPDVRVPSSLERRTLLAACGLALVLASWALGGLLRGRVLVDDESTYAYQAELLSRGLLADSQAPRWLDEPFTVYSRLGATGKYLFGEPLVQILGVWLGLPGLLHLALFAALLALWHRTLRPQVGDGVAGWATLFLAISPMLLFTTGTGMSHTTSLFALVLAGYGLARIEGSRFASGALWVACGLGLGLAVRPQVAVPAGAAILVLALLRFLRARAAGGLAVLAAVGALWLAAVLGYNALLTGSPWSLPWNLVPIPEQMGFGPVTPGSEYRHSLVRALENLATSAVRWNGWWTGSPWGLAAVAIWWRLGRPRAGLGPWLASGTGLVAFNFLYYSPGVSDTGPVYYFELLLPGSLMLGHAAVGALARWPALASWTLILQILLGGGSFFVEQAGRLARLANAIHRPAERALAAIERPALLIHENSPAETLAPGWVFGFPVRFRFAEDPVVTFPRTCPECARELRLRYPERACYYLRFNWEARGHELATCQEVEALLARPAPTSTRSLAIRSTAERLGWEP